MNKTQIINSIVGKRLEPYGFKYLKSDGISRVFLREVTGVKRYYDPENDVVKQYIDIQESRYRERWKRFEWIIGEFKQGIFEKVEK